MSCCRLDKKVYCWFGLNHEDARNIAEAKDILDFLADNTHSNSSTALSNWQSYSQSSPSQISDKDFVALEISKLALSKTDKALDLGSGNCTYTINLLKKCSVTAVDSCEKALDALKFSHIFTSKKFKNSLACLETDLLDKISYPSAYHIINVITNYFENLYLDLEKNDFVVDCLTEKGKFLEILSSECDSYFEDKTKSKEIVDLSINRFEDLFNKFVSFFKLNNSNLTTSSSSIEQFTSNLSQEYKFIILRDSLPYCNPTKIGEIITNCFNALERKGIILGTFFTYVTEPFTNIECVNLIFNIVIASTIKRVGGWTTTAKTIKIFIKNLIQTKHDLEFFESDGKVGFKITKL